MERTSTAAGSGTQLAFDGMESRVVEKRESTKPPCRITREDVLTAVEVARLLALPKSTVYELARRGELPCARLGRTIRFLREDIEGRLRGR
jgi:excisionase family DNA binding protein